MAFFAYLAVIAEEYVGIHHYLPIIKALKGSLLACAILCVYIVIKYDAREVFRNSQVILLLIFIFLTLFALLHGLVGSKAIDPLTSQIGYFLLIFIGFYLLDDVRKTTVFSIAFGAFHSILVLINANLLTSAERMGKFRAGYFLGDGNDFGWSMCVAFPFALFVFLTARSLLVRLMGAGFCLLITIGVVGTQSRGATLAMVAILFYGWLVMSNRKAMGLVGLAILMAFALILAPSSYFERIQTVSSYEEDTSATNRIRAWTRATEMAIDHPLLGVGAGSFNSAYGRYYRDVSQGDATRWISPHSIYFRVLGEYGFTGLILLLSILISVYRENNRTKKIILMNKESAKVSHYWPDILNMSLIGYSVAGVFLGGVYYPHIYLIIMLTINAKRLVYQSVDAHHSDKTRGHQK